MWLLSKMKRFGNTRPAFTCTKPDADSPCTPGRSSQTLLTQSPQATEFAIPAFWHRWLNCLIFYKDLPGSCLPTPQTHLPTDNSSFHCLLSVSDGHCSFNPLPPISLLRGGPCCIHPCSSLCPLAKCLRKEVLNLSVLNK